MRVMLWILAGLVVIVSGYYLLASPTLETQNPMTTPATSTHNGVRVIPIEHATGILRWGDHSIYFDPTEGAEAFRGQEAPDIVLVTDIHSDHFSSSTLSAVLGDAVLIVPKAVHDQLPDPLAERATVLNNGDSTVQQGFRIEATPMYNLPDAENADRHTKGRGNGYLIEGDGFRVLIAGDTAGTPELRRMQDIDIAFVPMNLPYTMGVDEAASAVLEFKPKVVYPYHYREPNGLADVNRFKQLVNAGDPEIEVVLGAWYPRN